MIKCEVIKKFTLKEFEKLKDVKKVASRKNDEFDVKDTFKCDKKMADYLMGENPFNETVIKILEVEPEKENDVIEFVEEEKIETINKDNVIEKLDEALEKIENKEIVETIPVVDKNNVVVDRVIKEHIKSNKKKKKSKKTSE